MPNRKETMDEEIKQLKVLFDSLSFQIRRKVIARGTIRNEIIALQRERDELYGEETSDEKV